MTAKSNAREGDGVAENLLLQAIARGWCAPENAGKVTDPNLAFAIEKEVRAYLAAMQAQQGSEASYCSDERPCIPCFTDTGPCTASPPEASKSAPAGFKCDGLVAHWIALNVAIVDRGGDYIQGRIDARKQCIDELVALAAPGGLLDEPEGGYTPAMIARAEALGHHANAEYMRRRRELGRDRIAAPATGAPR